jgi:hypothetical protein
MYVFRSDSYDTSRLLASRFSSSTMNSGREIEIVRRVGFNRDSGLVTAVAGLIGMFRNVTSAVSPVAEVNNYLLPVWMIVFRGELAAPRSCESVRNVGRGFSPPPRAGWEHFESAGNGR